MQNRHPNFTSCFFSRYNDLFSKNARFVAITISNKLNLVHYEETSFNYSCIASLNARI